MDLDQYSLFQICWQDWKPGVAKYFVPVFSLYTGAIVNIVNIVNFVNIVNIVNIVKF